MTKQPSDRWLQWYPTAWRRRYGDELAALVDDRRSDGRFGARARLSLVRGGLVERGRAGGVLGGAAAPTERIRGGALVVLAAWTAFVVGGIGFAKSSEHWQGALHGRARLAASIAIRSVQASAAVAAALIVLAALLTAPAVARLAVDGGWPQLRRRVLGSAGLGVAAAGAVAGIAWWAHHLDAAGRNGGDSAYSAAVAAVGVLVAAALASLAATAVRAARRAPLSPRCIRTCGHLAVGVVGAMVVGLGGGATWWAVVATRSPAFLGGAAPLPVVGAVGSMTIATAVGVAGTIRVLGGLRTEPV